MADLSLSPQLVASRAAETAGSERASEGRISDSASPDQNPSFAQTLREHRARSQEPARVERPRPQAEPAKAATAKTENTAAAGQAEAAEAAPAAADAALSPQAAAAAVLAALAHGAGAGAQAGDPIQADARPARESRGDDQLGILLGPAAGEPQSPQAVIAAAAAAAAAAQSAKAAGEPVSDGDTRGEPGLTANLAGNGAGARTEALALREAELAARLATDGAASGAEQDSASQVTSHGVPADYAAAHAAALGRQDVASTPGPEVRVATPVGGRGWSEEVGQRIVWLAGQNESSAELVLTPPQLGRVEISLDIRGDQASANFVAANPVAREALEQSLPRLREVLAQAGLQLGQANVSAGNGSGAQGDRREGGRRSGGAVAAVDGDALPATGAQRWTRGGNGLVDTFA